MKKMFLTSSFSDVASKLNDFEKDLKGKTITFIPTASIVEKVIFYVKSGRKALEDLGMIIDELEISTATTEEIKNKLEKNDYIYITGGNTFFLLQELKRTGADKIIIEQVNLCGCDALDLVDFYTIPHCDNFPFKKVADKIIATYSNSLKLKPINNKQVILVSDNDIRIETSQ